MKLAYSGKKTKEEVMLGIDSGDFSFDKYPLNALLMGDNLSIMRAWLRKFPNNKVDLVYIDPPFATNTVFRSGKERTSTISSSKQDQVAYVDNLKGADFIEFLRERFILLRELMSDSASIYLHIDYKIGHYVKVVMDEVFGIENFKNDISRIKCNPKNFSRYGYGNMKDMLLFYTKTNRFVWNEPLVDRTKDEIKRLFSKTDSKGRYYTTNPLHAPGETVDGPTGQPWKGMSPPKGRHWRCAPSVLDELESKGLIEWSKNGVPRKIIYADDYSKKKLQDIWEFKDGQNPLYPTQKNLEMLKTIVMASSNPGDVVLDCFCGSGTTLLAADELNRNWIGIDASGVAISVSKKRLSNSEFLLGGGMGC